VRRGRFALVTSALVRREVFAAPQNVQELFTELLAIAELIDIPGEAERLQRAYVDAGIVGERWLADAEVVADEDEDV
jgi:hypothetical protein